MTMEWKGTLSEALAVQQTGWKSHNEKVIWSAALRFINERAEDIYSSLQKNATCRTCGHNPFDEEDS